VLKAQDANLRFVFLTGVTKAPIRRLFAGIPWRHCTGKDPA
jgi:hypothetical protein